MENHSELYTVENGIAQYNFKKCLSFLESKGRSIYGGHFRIHQEDRPVIYKLLIYSIRDLENCKKHNIDPAKGILLTGPVGCGKTSLMNLLRFFCPPVKRYSVKPAREVAFEFFRDGYETIQLYGKRPAVFCFDDLGVEQTLKYYGNDCNVMAETLLSRYDLFIAQGIPTHATTNLNAKELEELYGNRLRSRMRELFNLIAFGKEVEDKRR